jgi:hypothetical protein
MKKNDLRVIEDELYNRESRRTQNAGEYIYNQTPEVKTPSKELNYPDARLHQIVSFIKSGIRILGYCFIPFNLVVSAILLILSEVVGIIEELV